MIAYIPARGGSKRILGKNIKELGGKPLICHVIENLRKVTGLKGIAVSTDSSEIKKVLEPYGDNICTLELRNPELSNDSATFSDLIEKDLPRFLSFFSEENVLFTTATSALVRPSSFEKAISSFKGTGLVMAVIPFENSPLLALKEEDNQLKPLHPKSYLLPTKDLSPCYSDAGCFYIFNSREVSGKEKLIDLSPIIPAKLNHDEGIDLDTPEDWRKLEKAFKNR